MTLPPLTPNAWLRWDAVSPLLPDGVHDVLEVGCGQGAFGVRLAQRYPSYVGLEPDTRACDVARARHAAAGGRGVVVGADLTGLPADQRFDLLCAFEVIEHIENDVDALRAWVNRLRPGGTLLLSTPAFAGRFAAADVMVGHFRRYDPSVLAGLLRDAGLEQVEVQQFGGPLGYLLETGRNWIGRRRLARGGAASRAEATAGSGRLLQPSRRQARLTELGTLPFRLLQRAVPGHGPGLVARGRVPAP